MRSSRLIHLLVTLALVMAMPGAASGAPAKKKSAGAPAPVTPPASPAPAPSQSPAVVPDSVLKARVDSMLRALRTRTEFTPVYPPAYATNPGPLLPPGSPIANRYTVVPWPIPGDPKGVWSERMKVMNVPRQGSVVPLSAPPETTPVGVPPKVQLH